MGSKVQTIWEPYEARMGAENTIAPQRSYQQKLYSKEGSLRSDVICVFEQKVLFCDSAASH